MSKEIQKKRLDFALVKEAFRAAVGDPEVVQRNLVPKHKGLKITLTLDTYEQKVWMMRQRTTLNAEDQQLPEHTFRNKWKQVRQEYDADINDPEAEVHAVQGQSSEVLPGHSEWLHQARKYW